MFSSVSIFVDNFENNLNLIVKDGKVLPLASHGGATPANTWLIGAGGFGEAGVLGVPQCTVHGIPLQCKLWHQGRRAAIVGKLIERAAHKI